jgi:hypothetical protein
MPLRTAGAAVGMDSVHCDHVFIDMILVGMVQVPIMEVINMPLVLNSCMPAARAVLVLMMLVLDAASLFSFLHISEGTRAMKCLK